MFDLVHAVAPNLPEDRHVKPTRDVLAWYKVMHSTRTLFVPPFNVLKVNMRELNSFAEAVHAFAVADLDSPLYDWTNITTQVLAGSFSDVVTGIEDLHHKMLQNDGWLSCDIETRRVEWEDNKLLAIGFGIQDAAVCVFDCDWSHPSVRKAFQELYADPALHFIWHNGKFDCTRLEYLVNYDARVDHDTMLQHYVSINEKQGTHGLKYLGQLYLQAPAWDDELDGIKREWCKQHKVPLKDFMYDSIPTHILLPYLAKDCVATYRLKTVFDKIARPESAFIASQLYRASNVYGKIELNGQRLDVHYLEDLEYDLDNLIRDAEAKTYNITKDIWDPRLYNTMTGSKAKVLDSFNPNSPKQLKWMLQQVLGHPVPSTDAVLMSSLVDDIENGLIDSPVAKDFITAIQDVRKYNKYMKTYVQGMRNVMCADFRVRCTFNLHGTETGRLSSSEPNMQNIPRNKMIKNLIIATPGTKLLQLDYSQAELRVLAVLSGDASLIKIYQEGKDLHDATTIDMFGEGSEKDTELRNLAKTINFGIAYGRGPSSIAEKFKKPVSEARAIIDKWFEARPGVKEYINTRRKMATRGEPCTTVLGRERHFIITNEELNHIQNEYINTPIQSIASDCTMLSLLDIYDYLEENWKGIARITTTVHDSIILEVTDNPEYIKTIAAKCIEIMAATPLKFMPDCPVPFVADADIGYKWGEMKKLDIMTGLEKVDEDH